MARLPNLAATITAPFSGRSGMTRAKLVRREGGTAKSEQSVEDGLDWLVRHQREDGSWSLNFQDHCQGTAVPRTDGHRIGHGGDRASALAPPGRRVHSHGQEQAPGSRAGAGSNG